MNRTTGRNPTKVSKVILEITIMEEFFSILKWTKIFDFSYSLISCRDKLCVKNSKWFLSGKSRACATGKFAQYFFQQEEVKHSLCVKMWWIQNWIGLDSNLNVKVCESIHPWTSLEGRCDCGGGHGNVVACVGGIQAQAAEQTVAELASNLVMKMLKLHWMMMLWRYSFMMIQSCHVICRLTRQ